MSGCKKSTIQSVYINIIEVSECFPSVYFPPLLKIWTEGREGISPRRIQVSSECSSLSSKEITQKHCWSAADSGARWNEEQMTNNGFAGSQIDNWFSSIDNVERIPAAALPQYLVGSSRLPGAPLKADGPARALCKLSKFSNKFQL